MSIKFFIVCFRLLPVFSGRLKTVSSLANKADQVEKLFWYAFGSVFYKLVQVRM